MNTWIGDKTCYYTPSTGASVVSTGASDETDVAEQWRTWSLWGAILFGVIIGANLILGVSGLVAQTGEAGIACGAMGAIGSFCCLMTAACGLVGVVIWGSVLRFGEAG